MKLKLVRIELTVRLPEDYDERAVDYALADTIEGLGGEVVDSKEFEELEGY